MAIMDAKFALLCDEVALLRGEVALRRGEVALRRGEVALLRGEVAELALVSPDESKLMLVRAFIPTITRDVLDAVQAAFPVLVRNWQLASVAQVDSGRVLALMAKSSHLAVAKLPTDWHAFVRCLYALQKVSDARAPPNFKRRHLSAAAFRDIVECWLRSLKSPSISVDSFITCTEIFVRSAFTADALKVHRYPLLEALMGSPQSAVPGVVVGQPASSNISLQPAASNVGPQPAASNKGKNRAPRRKKDSNISSQPTASNIGPHPVAPNKGKNRAPRRDFVYKKKDARKEVEEDEE